MRSSGTCPQSNLPRHCLSASPPASYLPPVQAASPQLIRSPGLSLPRNSPSYYTRLGLSTFDSSFRRRRSRVFSTRIDGPLFLLARCRHRLLVDVSIPRVVSGKAWPITASCANNMTLALRALSLPPQPRQSDASSPWAGRLTIATPSRPAVTVLVTRGEQSSLAVR